MELNKLTALCPIDGRYRDKCEELSEYLSEYALIKYRVFIEIEYFILLSQLKLENFDFNEEKIDSLRNVYKNFSLNDAMKIKEIENTTNHDVKAVEYFIKDFFDANSLSSYKEFIHFGLTSQDINNTAIPFALKKAVEGVYIPILTSLMEKLKSLSIKWKDIPMLARTHGQPASPTLLGKEIYIFYNRLKKQLDILKNVQYCAKFGGATGNMNAHFVAYPLQDWHGIADCFVEKKLELKRSLPTTQIEYYDSMAELFDALKRISTIIIDLDRDMWSYISMDYFKQEIKQSEVGSSAMPHKVNPIDFENSEGNLGLAVALFEHFAAKLPLSRLQRDLTDSTTLRAISIPIAHSFIAIKSTIKGIDKLIINIDKIEQDLQDNWAVVAEAIQTILRREKFDNPYELLKDLTRNNKKIDKKAIIDFIDNLPISDALKIELKNISPFNYVGKSNLFS